MISCGGGVPAAAAAAAAVANALVAVDAAAGVNDVDDAGGVAPGVEYVAVVAAVQHDQPVQVHDDA